MITYYLLFFRPTILHTHIEVGVVDFVQQPAVTVNCAASFIKGRKTVYTDFIPVGLTTMTVSGVGNGHLTPLTCGFSLLWC